MQLVGSSLPCSKAYLPLEAGPALVLFALTTRFMLSLAPLLGTGILEGEGRHHHMTSPQPSAKSPVSFPGELGWG